MRLIIDGSNILAGGAVTHLREILACREPERDGFTEVEVWGRRNVLDQLPERSWLVRRQHRLLEGQLLGRLAWQRVHLPRLAARRCDLLFAPGGSAAGRVRPYVAMSQNMLPFEWSEMRRYGLRRHFWRLALVRQAQGRALSRADGVIFLTEYAKRIVVRAVGSLRGATTVIPHGIEAAFNEAPRPQRPMAAFSAQTPLRVLYVSQIDAYKHQWNVASAVAALRHQGLPVELELVGPWFGPEMRRLRAVLDRVDPDGRYVFIRGRQPHAKLAAAYHRADVFVFASSCENLPNVLLEAMAAGLPIACSKMGPMPEVLGPAGEYFDPLVPDSIARTLGRILESPELRLKLAETAHARAARFTWQAAAEETFSFLAGVARPGSRRPMQSEGRERDR